MKQVKLYGTTVVLLLGVVLYGWMMTRFIIDNKPRNRTYMVDEQGQVWLKLEDK